MTHRRGCQMPPTRARLITLSDGTKVGLDRCPGCGAVALHQITPTALKENR